MDTKLIANICNNSLDDSAFRLVWNERIDLLFDPNLHVSERMENLTAVLSNACRMKKELMESRLSA